MREMHYVVVQEADVVPYVAKGFVQSARSAREELGEQVWRQMLPAERDPLVVMEIDAARHRAINENPRRFRVIFRHEYFIGDAVARQCEILEQGDSWSVVADPEHDVPPVDVATSELFETPSEAVLASRGRIAQYIALHRAAIENLEKFLRYNT